MGSIATNTTTVDARCPLCGVSVVSVGRDWHVSSEEFRLVPLYKNTGEGFMLCDACGILTSLPEGLTLN